MINVVCTHDVDRIHKSYQYFTHSARSLLHLDFQSLRYHLDSIFKKNPYWNFQEIIKIEEDFGIKSTFFFLSESIRFNPFKISNWKLALGRYSLQDEQVVNMIRWLDKNGWEIATHGSFRSFKNAKLLKREKDALERIVGHEVTGIRQHYLNLNHQTWMLQKQVGFKYDSSFGLINDVGFKDNVYTPFRPFNDYFLVFPLVIMDICFMDKEDKWNDLLSLLSLTEEKGAALVINWHQRVFNEQEFPGFKRYYIKIIEECKKRQAAFFTLSQYYSTLDSLPPEGKS